jgi:hypothetical protein
VQHRLGHEGGDEVINTWPLDRLRRFLAKGRAAPRAGAVKE